MKQAIPPSVLYVLILINQTNLISFWIISIFCCLPDGATNLIQDQSLITNLYLACIDQVARARELTAWAREALRQAEADEERKDEVAESL